MKKILTLLVILMCFGGAVMAQSDSDVIVLHNTTWDKNAHAGFKELIIPSAGSTLQGFMYTPNGKQKHPTLLMLHGYPGNEKNLDLAQVVRAHGWNVIYFDYRGSWGSPGKFSFKNCVEDVVNAVAYCKKNADALQIDTANMALFGHSMGGWICLKALQQLPGIKKGFALSTWNIYGEVKAAKNAQELENIIKANDNEPSFVLNTTGAELFGAVMTNPSFYDLTNDSKTLANKQIVMLDEHTRNKPIADAIKTGHKTYFDYQVWDTDHPFSNKRVSLMKKVLAFLDQ